MYLIKSTFHMEQLNEMETEQQNRKQKQSKYVWSDNENAKWMKR